MEREGGTFCGTGLHNVAGSSVLFGFCKLAESSDSIWGIVRLHVIGHWDSSEGYSFADATVPSAAGRPVGVFDGVRMSVGAMGFTLLPMPPFACLVLMVVFVGSEEKMGRINARRIIASVQDIQTLGNRADEVFIDEPMCSPDAATNALDSIALPVAASSPEPTGCIHALPFPEMRLMWIMLVGDSFFGAQESESHPHQLRESDPQFLLESGNQPPVLGA